MKHVVKHVVYSCILFMGSIFVATHSRSRDNGTLSELHLVIVVLSGGLSPGSRLNPVDFQRNIHLAGAILAAVALVDEEYLSIHSFAETLFQFAFAWVARVFAVMHIFLPMIHP